MISLSGVHLHRAHQLSTANEDISVYPSLKRFRDSASERRSFKKTLNMVIDRLTQKPRPVSPQQQTTPRAARAMRSQAAIQHTDLPLITTNKTPKRSVAAQIDRMEEKLAAPGKLKHRSKIEIVVERVKDFPGFPIFRIGSDGELNGPTSRGTCSHCGSQTHCFCLHCKRWLCDSMSKNVQAMDGFKPHIVINTKADDPIHAQNCCFLIVHGKNQQEALASFNKEAQKKLV